MVLAVIVTPVAPVILTLTKKSKSLDFSPTTSVKLNAHLISYATSPPLPKNARWIVSITATNALTPPPVTSVMMVITLIPLPLTYARLASQTATFALMEQPVPPVQLVMKPSLPPVTPVQVIISKIVTAYARSAP